MLAVPSTRCWQILGAEAAVVVVVVEEEVVVEVVERRVVCLRDVTRQPSLFPSPPLNTMSSPSRYYLMDTTPPLAAGVALTDVWVARCGNGACGEYERQETQN
ncbi:hypothetical protein E2C01_039547 [Portunus trituberculatus]|uniref:Uncharacterized protein n=1 Tax=Portunus trituberculatus TaxID=210409 RepID=A0A5B7FF10_PORTR|nr:hypothetical protein [Portunus trituberculatus]